MAHFSSQHYLNRGNANVFNQFKARLRTVRKLRLGVIGFGRMGQQRLEAATQTGLAEVLAVYDPNVQVDPKLRVETEDDIFLNPKIEAVFIATINSENERLTIKALESGKHVFCEKPPALNAAGVRRAQEARDSSNKVVMYGFNHRHHGAARRMKEILDSGSFGRILWMRGRYGKSVDEDFLKTWRADKNKSGGGILMDQGIHMLDLLIYLSDGFDEIQAMSSSVFWDIPGIEDNVFINLRNRQTGLVASLHSTMVQWRHLFSLEVFLEDGYLALNGLKTSTDSYGAEKLVVNKNVGGVPSARWDLEEEYEWPVDDSWNEEMRLFHTWVTTGVKPEGVGSTEDAFEVMKVIDSVYANSSDTSSAAGEPT